MEGQVGELLALEPQEAGKKLLAGEIDMAFMMTSWESPVVQQLLADDRVKLSSFLHADAFIALYPFLNKVVVPRGVIDIAKDRPSNDVVLIATKASLVVRKDLHPQFNTCCLTLRQKSTRGRVSLTAQTNFLPPKPLTFH